MLVIGVSNVNVTAGTQLRSRLSVARQLHSGQGRRKAEVLHHAQLETHPIGHLSTSDQLVAEAATYTTYETNIHAFRLFRTCDSSYRVVADVLQRPHDHRDQILL